MNQQSWSKKEPLQCCFHNHAKQCKKKKPTMKLKMWFISAFVALQYLHTINQFSYRFSKLVQAKFTLAKERNTAAACRHEYHARSGSLLRSTCDSDNALQGQPTQNWQVPSKQSWHQKTNQGRTSGLQIKLHMIKINHKVEGMSSCHGGMLGKGIELSLSGSVTYYDLPWFPRVDRRPARSTLWRDLFRLAARWFGSSLWLGPGEGNWRQHSKMLLHLLHVNANTYTNIHIKGYIHILFIFWKVQCVKFWILEEETAKCIFLTAVSITFPHPVCQWTTVAQEGLAHYY